MSDFNNLNDPFRRDFSDDPVTRSRNATWGWVAAAVFIVVVLAIVFGAGKRSGPADTNTAYNTPPAASHMAPPITNPTPLVATPTPPATAPAPISPAPNGPAATAPATSGH
jgi:hypothetical protein